MLLKLKKECQDIELGQNDKVLIVLAKNVEVALEEKRKVAALFYNVKKALNNDYSIEEIKEVYKQSVISTIVERILSLIIATNADDDTEEIPEEVDKALHKIMNPITTRRFSNRFQQLSEFESQHLDPPNHFTPELNEFGICLCNKPNVTIQKSFTEIRFGHQQNNNI